MKQIAAPDVTDASRALRRQLEEEEARRTQMEQQMREMQAREFDIKRYTSLMRNCLIVNCCTTEYEYVLYNNTLVKLHVLV